MLPVILDTGSVWVPDRGIWDTFEKAVSKKARTSHVGQKSVSYPDFCLGSALLHCKCGEDEGTERRKSTILVWLGSLVIESRCNWFIDID